MHWKEYYKDFHFMPRNERVSKISSIDDFSWDDAAEIVDIAASFGNSIYATRLIKKAMECKVSFSTKQASKLIDCVTEDFRRNLVLAAYGRYTEQQLEHLRCYLSEDDIKALEKPKGAKHQCQKSDAGIGFLGHVFAITAALCKQYRRRHR